MHHRHGRGGRQFYRRDEKVPPLTCDEAGGRGLVAEWLAVHTGNTPGDCPSPSDAEAFVTTYGGELFGEVTGGGLIADITIAEHRDTVAFEVRARGTG